jgi:hypothetical protein
VQALVATEIGDAEVPAPGEGFFYLVQGQNDDLGLGPLGWTSSELPRVNMNPASCAGAAVVDAHPSGQVVVGGTVSGTLAALASSDNQYQSIVERLSSGPPAERYSWLEHRWTFNVPAGGRKELHVEGFHSTSLDNDGFSFEWSADGTNFTFALVGIPGSDDGIDLIGPLPSNLSGQVTIRVLDWNRDIGATSLDTVTLDEVWIRTVP